MSDRGGGGGRGGKRGGGDGPASAKNKKAKYYSKHAGGSGQALPPGRPGVMITCDPNWEPRAQNEALALIEEHYDKLAGTSSKPAAKAEGEGKKDISALIAAEVAELKDKSKQRFTPHGMSVNGCVFIMFPQDIPTPSPVDVVISIMEEAKSTKTLRARHCNRMLPIMHTCFAGLEEIKKMGPLVVAGHFPKGGTEGFPFAADYEHRSAEGLDRMAVIDAFVGHVVQPPNKVNLSAPEKTIIVQISRNSCGASVVPKYKELARFNIKKLTETEAEAAAAARLAEMGKQRRAKEAAAAAAKETAREAAKETAKGTAAAAVETAKELAADAVETETAKEPAADAVETTKEPAADAVETETAKETAADAVETAKETEAVKETEAKEAEDKPAE